MKEWRVAVGDIIHLRYKLSHLLGISHVREPTLENMLLLGDPGSIMTINKFGTRKDNMAMERVNTIFSRTSGFFPGFFIHVSHESSEHSRSFSLALPFFFFFWPENSETQEIVLTEVQCVRPW